VSPSLSSPRLFALHYRRERAGAGALLPRHMLAAYLGQPGPLCDWLSPFSPAELSLALETILERDAGHKQHGAYATGVDVARYMAANTIVPFLLADLAADTETLAGLVAANRDLESLAQDWLTSATPRQLRTFLARLESLTVLDPTCGTGPFLLAALHVLEPLHDICLQRLARSRSASAIRRHLIEQTLHGVDLLPEAVEVCRLRLRLELLAAGDRDVLELRDNLRVGNALTPPPTLFSRCRYDVLLGNPPYLELRQVSYVPKGFRCQDSGAIHALCIERGLDQLQPRGWMSMIVPLSLVSTQRMKCVQDLLEAGRHVWYANFSWRPARLFAAVNRAVTLFVTTASDQPRTWTTAYQKWRSRDRLELMRRIRYVEAPRHRPSFWVPKLSDKCERPLLDRLLRIPTVVQDFLGTREEADCRIYYRTDGGLYWKVFTDFAPSFSLDGRAGRSSRQTWLTVAEPGFVAPLI
jgi:hypothetical protein